jgi:hypothetical protein
MNNLEANLDKLSSELQDKITNNPTNTILSTENNKINAVKKFDNGTTPDIFDGISIWKDSLTPVRNQGKCGSCWAFATTSALANRFNIQSMGLMDVSLSATKLILCDWGGTDIGSVPHPSHYTEGRRKHDIIKEMGDKNFASSTNTSCYGSTLSHAARFLYEIGTTTEKCLSYDKELGDIGQYQKLGSFDSTVSIPLCFSITGSSGDMCSDQEFDEKTGMEFGTPSKFYKCINYYSIMNNEEQIRLEIYKWGPVVASMEVYPDFYTFDNVNAIYKWDGKNKQVGGHAVEIVGWGEDNGIPYWQIKNSWGVEWGMGGYFRMIRGKNNCKIESNCLGLQPDFFYPNGYKNIQHVEIDVIDKKSRENSEAIRINLTKNVNVFAGGIDPTTGYTRRVMTMYPWLNFRRPVKLNDLPNWNKFMAAREGTVENRILYDRSINDKNLDIIYSNRANYIYIAIVVTIIIVIIFLLIKVINL